jgi:hypothetical protein
MNKIIDKFKRKYLHKNVEFTCDFDNLKEGSTGKIIKVIEPSCKLIFQYFKGAACHQKIIAAQEAERILKVIN